MKSLRFVGELFSKYPRLLAAAAALWTLVSLADAVTILAVAPVVDFLVHPDLAGASGMTLAFARGIEACGLPPTLGGALAVFVGFSFLSAGLQVLGRHLILRAKYAVLKDLMVSIFGDFFAARWQFFTAGSQGTLLNTFNRELSVVGDAFAAMALFAANLIKLALYLAVPLWLSWKVALASFGAAAVFAAPFLLLGRLNYRLGRDNTATANRLNAILHENLSLAKIVLGFGNQRQAVRALDESFEAHRTATLKSQTLDMAIPILYQPLGLGVLILPLLAAQRFGVPLAESAALFYSLFKIVPVIGQLAAQKNSFVNFLPSYEQIQTLRARAKELSQAGGGRPFPGLTREISLDGLSFAYPGQPPVLDGLSLKIPRGSMVAVVGESGAGKSTLADLLLGLNEPTGGRIAFDGVALGEFDSTSYRRRVGFVPQDPALFNLSVRDNLVWAHEGATEAEIKDACRLANAAEFIERLPQGYDTVLGDRGVRLSGGQVQRLALARAIIRKPELLILDEATSALDTQSERLIQQAIDTIAKQTTMVVIAHRLSTIANADMVFVLRRGRLVEQGPYAALVAAGGPFQQMAKLQALQASEKA